MALSDKEREQIIEEERVRFETRRLLLRQAYAQGGACGYGWHGHRHRFGFHILKALLLVGGIAFLISHLACRF
jgi:hypothetical protein